MIIEILDQIIDSQFDESDPKNFIHKGFHLQQIKLGVNMMNFLISELEEKLPAGTEINYIKTYRGISLDDTDENFNYLIPVYQYETTQS